MEVQLTHKDEFRRALAHYCPSEEARDTLAAMPLVILLSVTGGGRNTIIHELVKTGRYHFIVSDTTRPPKIRNGVRERDGAEYYFRSELDMLADITRGAYLEAEIIHDQQVSGTSVRELIKAHGSGKIPVGEVDMGGANAIMRAKQDTVAVFIVPPGYEEWMRRLARREEMPRDELRRRLQTAARVLSAALSDKSFVFVVNDSLSGAAEMIDRIVTDHTIDKRYQQTARAVAKALYRAIVTHHPDLGH
jgi:guanylate kinase